MLYLLLVLILGTFLYVGWRAARSQVSRPKSRVIGPDDDPDFLKSLDRYRDPRTTVRPPEPEEQPKDSDPDAEADDGKA